MEKEILDRKIEESVEEEQEEQEAERKALKRKAKSRKTKVEDDVVEPEVAEAVNKGKAKAIENVYKNADDADSSDKKDQSAAEKEPETNGEIKAHKMRNYFKKSQVYNTYQKEQMQELIENQKIIETQQEINHVKYNMQNLMGKYQQLQNKVRHQNEVAKSLEQSERSRIIQQEQQ